MWITDRSRYNINTNTRQNKTVLEWKSDFLTLFLHRIEWKDKECKIYMLLLLTRVMWRSSSHLCVLLSGFWLSGHLFLAMQFISEFIWVNVRWGKPKLISYFVIDSHWKSTYFAHTARTNQRSQKCRFETPTKKKKNRKNTEPNLRLDSPP